MKPTAPSPALLTRFLRDLARFAGRRAPLAIGLALLGGLLEGIGLALLIPLAGLLADDATGFGARLREGVAALGVETRLGQLALVLAIFVCVVVLRAVILRLRDRTTTRLQIHFIEHLRGQLVRALAAARWQHVAKLRHARVTNALGAEIQRVSFATQAVLQVLISTIMLAAQLAIAILVSPVFGLVILVILQLAALATTVQLRGVSVAGTAVVGRQARIADLVGQFIAGLKVALAQNLQTRFVRDFETTVRDLSERQLRLAERQSIVRVAVTSATALVGAAALLGGLWLGVPVAELIVLIAIAARMSRPALALQQNGYQLASLLPAYGAASDLHAELSLAAEVPAAPVASSDWSGPIVFENVSFAHGDGGGVRDLSLHIDRGGATAIVGPSGAGKTTLLDLLTGMLEPDAGTIRVGSTPLDHASSAAWRGATAYVPQDPYLFNASIRANLELGPEPVDEAALWEALEVVGADSLVRNLADGLETMAGERGIRLSGGERQRIALAGALLRRPGLLILDEATNAIDVASERAIWQRLLDMPALTVIVVAHRTEVLEHCDSVFTLENGRIAGRQEKGLRRGQSAS